MCECVRQLVSEGMGDLLGCYTFQTGNMKLLFVKVIAVGWGKLNNDNKKPAASLRKVSLSIYPIEKCQKKYKV